jgi:hypothetical protein
MPTTAIFFSARRAVLVLGVTQFAWGAIFYPPV